MSLYRKVQNVPIVDHLLIHWPPSNSMVHLYMDVCTEKLCIIITTFIWGGEMMHKPVGRKSRDRTGKQKSPMLTCHHTH